MHMQKKRYMVYQKKLRAIPRTKTVCDFEGGGLVAAVVVETGADEGKEEAGTRMSLRFNLSQCTTSET